jgi:AAA+ ATPase superfamily predicted ATPase
MDKSILSKYTSVLEDLGFIERTYPIAITPKPRKGLYTIADNYLNFWFKYIFPNKTELEAGNTQGVLNKIKLDYNTYLGYAFEQVATEFLTEMKNQNKLPFTFTALGKWWYKNNEIDIVALDEEKQTATFIETKWSTLNKIDCARIAQNLKAKTQDFRWNRKQENYGIIAKKITEKNHLTSGGCLTFDLTDFESLISNNR